MTPMQVRPNAQWIMNFYGSGSTGPGARPTPFLHMRTPLKNNINTEESIDPDFFGLLQYWHGYLRQILALLSVLIFRSEVIKQATGDALSADLE